MQRETLPQIRARIRAIWTSRRANGIYVLASGLHVDRIIALEAAGRISHDDAIRTAREAEAVALMFPPMPMLERSGVSL